MELSKELQEIVMAAGGQRDSYKTNDYLELAIMAVSEKWEINARGQLSDRVNKFLDGNGILHAHTADLEKLVMQDRYKVKLVGSTFHFAKRGFIMVHDAYGNGKDVLTNPVPLIDNVFSFIEPVGGREAADFLDKFGSILRREPVDTRADGVRVMRDILPELKSTYERDLFDIESKNKKGGSAYNRKKAELYKEYTGLLTKVIAHTSIVIKNGSNISLSAFYEYIGKGPANHSQPKVELSRKYLDGLLAQKLSYQAIIEDIEKIIGALIAVDSGGNRGTDQAAVDILYGNQSNPSRIQYKVTKGKDKQFLHLLIGICDYIKQKSGVDRQYMDMTKLAENQIRSVLL